MAGYHLYLKDSTYMSILQTAAKEGLTFGKKVNMILNDFVSNETNIVIDNSCEICGKEAFYECFLHNSKKSYRCFWHKPGREYKGYREVITVDGTT